MIFHLDYHFSYEFENEKEPETKQNKTKWQNKTMTQKNFSSFACLVELRFAFTLWWIATQHTHIQSLFFISKKNEIQTNKQMGKKNSSIMGLVFIYFFCIVKFFFVVVVFSELNWIPTKKHRKNNHSRSLTKFQTHTHTHTSSSSSDNGLKHLNKKKGSVVIVCKSNKQTNKGKKIINRNQSLW